MVLDPDKKLQFANSSKVFKNPSNYVITNSEALFIFTFPLKMRDSQDAELLMTLQFHLSWSNAMSSNTTTSLKTFWHLFHSSRGGLSGNFILYAELIGHSGFLSTTCPIRFVPSCVLARLHLARSSALNTWSLDFAPAILFNVSF